MPPWERYQTAQQAAPQAPQQQAQPPRTIGGNRVLGGVPASEQRAQRGEDRADAAAARAAAAAERANANSANANAIAQERLAMAQRELELREQAQGNPTAARLSRLQTLLAQADRVDQLHRQDIEGGLPNPIAGALPFVPSFEAFDSASAGLSEQGLAAFRVPGIGSQSDSELRAFVDANRPSASDTDARIREKLRNIRERAQSEIEALGGVVAAPTAQHRDGAPAMIGGDFPPAAGGTTPSQGEGPAPIGPDGDGRILGNTHNGGDDLAGMAIADQPTSREDDPALAGVRDAYTQRLMGGQSVEQILRYLRSAGVTISPVLVQSVRDQVAFRQQNPSVPAGEYDTSQLDDKIVRVGPATQAMGQMARSPLGTYAINAADMLTGSNLDSMAGAMGGNAEQVRGAIRQVSQENPTAALTGAITGGVLGTMAGEAGLARAGMTGLARGFTADAAFGAATGAGMTDYSADGGEASFADRASGAGMGAMAGLAGSYAGQRVGNALAATARGAGNSAANALRGQGINALTIGQSVNGGGRVGAIIKGAEDRLSGIPVVGDMINARRGEGVRQFNSVAFDKALEPIGGSVQGKVGQEAVEAAQEQVSQAFTDALAGVGVQADDVFARDLSEAVQTASGRLGKSHPAMIDDIAAIFQPFADDEILSGEALQIISRELRDLKSANRMDARFKAIATSIDRIERTVFDLYDRQASGVVPAYNKARQAYRRLATLEDAVMKAQNQSDQMFSPAQLNRADTASGRKLEGRRAAARGATPFNDLAVAGQEVLPNKVPDSGTAGRLATMIMPAALLGGGGAADAAGAGGTGLTIGAILAGLYTKAGQRLLTKPLRGMREGTRRRAILESERTKRVLQGGAATGSAVALTNQR